MWQNTYENWVPDPTDDLPTLTVATSPNFASDNIVFAGIQDAVVHSYDRCDSWDAAGLAVPPPVVTALALSPNFVNDHMLLAGTYEDGIFRSEDGGGAGANFGLLDLNVMALVVSPDFANDTTAFAGTTRACLRARTVGWRGALRQFIVWAVTQFCGRQHVVCRYRGTWAAAVNGLETVMGSSWRGTDRRPSELDSALGRCDIANRQ